MVSYLSLIPIIYNGGDVSAFSGCLMIIYVMQLYEIRQLRGLNTIMNNYFIYMSHSDGCQLAALDSETPSPFL